MSYPNTPVEYDVIPVVDALPETLPETQEVAEESAPAPKKKNVASRIFAAVLVALSAILLFLPVYVVNGAAFEKLALLNVVKDLFANTDATKLFNALPVLTDTATVSGQISGILFYVLLLSLVLTVVFGVITLLCGKTALLRVTNFFFSFGTIAYAANVAVVSMQDKLVLDTVFLAATVVGLIIYIVLAVIKNGKKGLVNVLQLLLTVVVATAASFALLNGATAVTEALTKLNAPANTVKLAFVLVLVLSYFIAMIRVQTKKGLTLDMVRYIVQLAISAAILYFLLVENAALTLAIVAAVVSFLQIVVCSMQIKSGKEKIVEEDEPVEEPVPEFTVEEYAEALPYEGGPVEGVEIAQEVNPTFLEAQPEIPVQTAGYDFYNCKSFDPFIATLNNEERNQFTELFVLKYKGVMPEIPEYVVGGDNKEFFRKMFIYLGQYRDRIPDGLLAKIYQFAIKF